MTEKEAIERLNRFKTIKVLYGNTFAMHLEQLEQLQNDIETVLNLLEKKNIRIKQLQKHNKKLDLEAQKYFEETIKQDKVIDLMCEIISAIETDIPTIKEQFKKEYCEFINSDNDYCWNDDKDCKDCIKQWIEKKVNLNND